MKPIAATEAQKARLNAAVHSALTELLEQMKADDRLYQRVRSGMSTLDVLVIVRYVQWSKWPFHREAVRLEPDTLHDPLELARVAEIVSANLTDLLARDLNEGSLEVLCTKLDAETLGRNIARLYMNKFTANALMVQMLAAAIEDDFEKVFAAATAGWKPLSSSK